MLLDIIRMRWAALLDIFRISLTLISAEMGSAYENLKISLILISAEVGSAAILF